MNLATQLRQEEGSVPHAYQDHLGYWTIGVGRHCQERLTCCRIAEGVGLHGIGHARYVGIRGEPVNNAA